MESTVWTDVAHPVYPGLDGDLAADVAVIGGGLAGILTAEAACRAGYSVVVLEADRVGCGESARSSAMVSYAHDYVYARLCAKHGKKKAREYLSLNKRGVARIRECVKHYGLDCDWHDCDMHLFATTDGGERRLITEQKAYAKLGENVLFSNELELPFSVRGALTVKGQGRLNPYAFVTGLAAAISRAGVRIFEGVTVNVPPKGDKLVVGDITITAKRFVIATHYPYINVPGWYFTKMYQSRSHNVAFRSDVQLSGIYESIEDEGFEYRAVSPGVVMCGGGAVRTGKLRASRYEEVIRKISATFGGGQEDIVCRFSAQDCITYDLMPFIGRYGGEGDNVFVITGFNKWGFSTAAIGSELLVDAFRSGSDVGLFSPSRLYMLKSPLVAAKNLACVAAGYAGTLFGVGVKRGKPDLRPGEAVIVKRSGKRIGLYMHHGGEVDAIEVICPHLGCGLTWNPDSKSWDCPCHGSRFDTKGNVLSSPATGGC